MPNVNQMNKWMMVFILIFILLFLAGFNIPYIRDLIIGGWNSLVGFFYNVFYDIFSS